MKLSNLTLPETTPSTPMKLYCDASCEVEDMSFAGWVFCDHNGRPADLSGADLGKGWYPTQAEIESVIRALSGISHYEHVQHIKVYSDSKNAIRRLKDEYDLEDGFERVSIEWVPREENKVADMIADRLRASKS